jgi:coproporphyrinogen III oxidase-like Fe-S oxidoreductase
LRYLEREVDLHTQQIGLGQAISQLHLGGGSPTFLSDVEMGELMAMLRRNFNLPLVVNTLSRLIPEPWMQCVWTPLRALDLIG